MTQVSRAEFNAIVRAQREKAAARKAKREEKRQDLPWGARAAAWKRKKMVASPREIMRAKLDGLWAFLIKLRDRLRFGGLCRICGRRPIAVAYHLVPRGDDATRWDPENGVGACAPCNRGEQMNRHRYRAKHVQLFGAEKIERLEAKARTIANFSMTDLDGIRAGLVAKIVELGGHR